MKNNSSGKKFNDIWGGRFSSSTDEIMQEFNSSIQFDKILYLEDIEGSLTHSEMLCRQKIISKKDFELIKSGLKQIRTEISNNVFNFSLKLEDIHMNIENRLVEIIGDPGKKLHTARSRNDQVATDIKLWLRRNIDEIDLNLCDLQGSLIEKAEENYDLLMPSSSTTHNLWSSFVSVCRNVRKR